jgi:small subunit ribosomal protein S16
MLSIRLRRIGKTKRPSYRLIVLDKRKDPWGSYLEDLGFYNPLTNPSTIQFKDDRVKHWLTLGAQPSSTVHNILVDKGMLQTPKVRVAKPKKKASKEGAPVAAAPAAPSAPAPAA